MRLLPLLFGLPLLLSAGSQVTFIKEFKGAVPPYVEITIRDDGSAVYKESPEDDRPVDFQLSAKDTETVFTLVANIGHCGRPLESGLKVANLGAKTLRCEDASGKRELTYNYSTDPAGQAITDFFERLRESQQLMFKLETAVRFDKLGVNKVLLQIETFWDRNQLVAPERFLPMLERITKNDTFMNMARERADRLIIAFHNGKTVNTASEAPAQGSLKP
jgi:hypothetical protein